jgi:Zn-dependent M28 family amino/carboxypeptidase
MEGRRTASAGEARAARFIAARFREARLEPAGDDGFFQRLPMVQRTTTTRLPNGQERTRTGPQMVARTDLDTVPAERRLTSVNVIGIIRGSDPQLATEVVVVGAHFDHVGIRAPVDGDSIANGADDDASGTVAVMEAARIVAAGPRPKRTIVFAAFTGEESGGYGSRWYLGNPVGPLDRHVAQIQVEMIGRPDSAAGGPGKVWLTGYERSTMGSTLAAAGLPVVADPRPEQSFYTRSDNIAFARRGIIAHTLSSFGLHKEYHGVNDEVELVDFDHMTAMVNLVVKAVRIVADGPRLQWNEGGRP